MTEVGRRRARADRFPYTHRPLPWLLAVFVFVLFFVPIDSTQVRVHLPVSSYVDRFVVLILIVAWIWYGGDQRAILRTPRTKLYVGSACVFLGLAIASVLFDAIRLNNLGQFTLAERQIAQLASYFIVGWFALTALRYEDVRGFCTMLIGMGFVLAVGMLVERETGTNVFYAWSAAVLKPVATVAPAPTDIHPAFGTDGRVTVVGPTVHGLAATALLMSVFPLALVRAIDPVWGRSRVRYGVAALLMILAATATDRKTALLVPVALVLYIAVYRRRLIVRLLPLWLLLVPVAIHFAAPGALGVIIHPSAATDNSSTSHRLGDFSPVVPDILVHPILGRGYGAVDPVGQPSDYRINDDQYVDMVQQIGIAGLIAYVWMIVAPLVRARPAIRGPDPEQASLALATSAGCVTFLVVNALFDTMSFPQAPYVFFLVASLATIATSGPRGNCVPSPGVAWRRRAIQRLNAPAEQPA